MHIQFGETTYVCTNASGKIWGLSLLLVESFSRSRKPVEKKRKERKRKVEGGKNQNSRPWRVVFVSPTWKSANFYLV